jgi:hypothetical protein
MILVEQKLLFARRVVNEFCILKTGESQTGIFTDLQRRDAETHLSASALKDTDR